MIEEKLIEVDRVGVLEKINKSEYDMEYYVQQIINWLEKQPHLPKSNRTIMEYILVHHKFNLERATTFIDKYYTIKHIVPEVFDNWDISTSEIQKCLYTCGWLPLSKMTKNYERITIFRLLNTDPKVFNPFDLIKCYCLMVAMRLYQNEFCAAEHMVFDMAGLTIEHFLKFTTLSFQKKHKIIMEGRTPVILNGFHFLNIPTGFDILFKIVKTIMKPKMLNRVYIHNEISSLYQAIPKEILPKDYGGDNLPYTEIYEKWVQTMIDNSKLFVAETEVKSDESKRICESNYKNVDSLINECDGMFRKLEID